MFTLNEVEIEFLKVLGIEAKTNKFIDKTSEEFKLTDSKEDVDGHKQYTYTCDNSTIIIDINEHSVIGIKRSITVTNEDTKYVFYSEESSNIADRMCVTIGAKDNFFGSNRETIAVRFRQSVIEYGKEDEPFMIVSVKNSFHDDLDTAFVVCSQSNVRIQQCNSETPFSDTEQLTGENYEKYLDLLIGYVNNSRAKDEFIPFISFFQSVVPLFFINREMIKINQDYNKRIDFENDKFQQKLANSANAKRSDKINERRMSATKRLDDERNEIIAKYEKVKMAFSSSYERNGRQIRVYRTDEFE